jgi:dTDP-4-dehydrorhamnose 3,5-epimerase-like enzyme
MTSTPHLIPGGLSVDTRGEVLFANGFDPSFAGIRRVYLTSNHGAGIVRAWHWHEREAKYVTAVSGSALVGAVEVPDWQHPDSDSAVDQFVLSVLKPAVLFIPPGYANGWMSLTSDCQLLWFSTATLDESRVDDVRFPARFWDCWQAEER